MLHFGSAFPVTFVFSLLIYWMAISWRLDPESVKRYVEQSRQEAEYEDAEVAGL